jgi:hypothetical protein
MDASDYLTSYSRFIGTKHEAMSKTAPSVVAINGGEPDTGA